MIKIANLQYISQGKTFDEQATNIKNVLDHGIQWVQLRWKYGNKQEVMDLARLTRIWCTERRALLIINDHVDIARKINADGVHLGLEDMPIAQARQLLGHSKIIGGTANTLDDVTKRIGEECDYIGLGPFRYTPTKENLSPLLGPEGYLHIIERLKKLNTNIPPIVAIGGIQTGDIQELTKIGVYGVAMSSTISAKPSDIELIKKYYER